MHDNDVNFQLVPPHSHQRNAAKRAIQTWKAHFITILSSTNPNVSLHLWCRLINQVSLTLNLLRPSRINLKLSSKAQLNGQFDYNKAPLASPGIKILIHERASTRSRWAPHGLNGWYLGPAREYYRCHRVYATKTSPERIADTVEFFPHQSTMPTTSSADAA
jgi:hypothetical protein